MLRVESMRSYALFFIFFLQLSLAGFSYSVMDHQDNGEDETPLNIHSPGEFELIESSSSPGLFFRFGNDFTFRRYGDYLSLNGLRALPSLAFNIMKYWLVSKKTASVLSRWTENTVTLHTAQVLSMAILPSVESALYSWCTGTRSGSEQIQVDSPQIGKRFYLELIYQLGLHQQMLRITPFPLNPSTSPTLAGVPLPNGYSHWLELYEASWQHSVVHIDLSWVSPTAPEAIRIDIHYSDKATESTVVTLTHNGDLESLPVSIESLLHNEAKDEAKDFARGRPIASLLTDAVIKNTVALIQNRVSAATHFPVSRVAGQLEFDADGYSGQLSLCGEQQPDCDSHLQLTYKPFPYPHFGMILQGQDHIKGSVDATIKQLANANRAELILQLVEKVILHIFITSFQQINQDAEHTDNDYFQSSLRHDEQNLETAIVPSHHKPVAPQQPMVETLMPASQFPDSAEPPVQWPDESQMNALKSGVVKTESVKSPAQFQENDILLVYPQNAVDHPSFDLNVNPGEMRDALRDDVRRRLVFLYENNLRDDRPTRDEEKSLEDSILTRLPTPLYEFLNKDWSGRDRFAPEEYQALAKFHSAFIFFDEDDYMHYENCNNIGVEFVTYAARDEKGSEFNKFLIKECLPLREGWSLDEQEIIQSWLNSELQDCQAYPEREQMAEYVKLCHYGPLKADCVSVCSDCYCAFENQAAYNRIKNLESQVEKLP